MKQSVGSLAPVSRRLLFCLLLLLLAGSSGCGGLGCQCAEPMGAKRTRPEGETVIAPQQQGEPSTITITVPPQVNASVCLC